MYFIYLGNEEFIVRLNVQCNFIYEQIWIKKFQLAFFILPQYKTDIDQQIWFVLHAAHQHRDWSQFEFIQVCNWFKSWNRLCFKVMETISSWRSSKIYKHNLSFKIYTLTQQNSIQKHYSCFMIYICIQQIHNRLTNWKLYLQFF